MSFRSSGEPRPRLTPEEFLLLRDVIYEHAGLSFDGDAHIGRHARRRLVVIDIFDLRQHLRRVGPDTGLERHRDVDEAACHGVSSAAAGTAAGPVPGRRAWTGSRRPVQGPRRVQNRA